MSHLIYNVKTLVYVVTFSIIIVVYFSITIYTIHGELWHYSGRIMALFGSKSGLRKRKF